MRTDACRFELGRPSRIKLVPPKFTCDGAIGPGIEDPLPKRFHFMAICGSPGSGKTSMLINLLKSKQCYRKLYHSVHVVMPPHSRASMSQDLFKNHDKVYDDLDWQTLDTIHAAMEKDSEEKYKSLVVMDDVTASLKDGEVQRLLRQIAYNRRHLKCSVLVLAQNYRAIPLAVRKTLSHLIMFKPTNKAELGAIGDELLFEDRDTVDRLAKACFREPHDFLFADVGAGKVYRNFAELTKKDPRDDAIEENEEVQGPRKGKVQGPRKGKVEA